MILKKGKKIFSKYFLVLLLILITGSFMRFYNINWDQGFNFHPDERNIDAAVSRISIPGNLNPQFFAYGGFVIYLYRLTAQVIAFFFKDNSWFFNWGKINIIGRFYSAFFSSLAIIFIYKLTLKVSKNKKVALISSFILAFSPSLIQIAHFATTESLLVLLVILICYKSIIMFDNPSLKNFFHLGLLIGLSLAVKTTALSFLLFPAISVFFILIKKRKSLPDTFKHFIVFALTETVVFLLFSPYTIISYNKFLESMKYESGVVSGRLAVPYTLSFSNTIPYLFQIKNLVWQMGPIVLISFIGLVSLFIRAIKNKSFNLLIFLIFILSYFLYVGSWHTKFIRYMTIIIPFLAISSAFFIFEFFKKRKLFLFTLGFLILFSSLVWSLLFIRIYFKPQTRIVASEWIYNNINEDNLILKEHWDDGLPVEIKPGKFNTKELEIYNPDNEEKINYLSQNLSEADYVVINSRRLYGTLINLKDKYPVTSSYYKLLFSGELGYQLAVEFSSYPGIGDYTINDDSSEETFQVYDHPKVLIFKNSMKYEPELIRQILVYNSDIGNNQ